MRWCWVALMACACGRFGFDAAGSGGSSADASGADGAGDAGLVGHWKLDELSGTTAADSSGNGNNGTYLNTPTPTSGILSNALDFSGDTGSTATNDRVSISDPADGKLDFGTGSFSYGLWVYVTATSTTFDMPWSKGRTDTGSIGNGGYDMELGSGAWSSFIGDGAGGQVLTYFNGSAPILNRWVHLMSVVDRPGAIVRNYVDGSQYDTTVIPGAFGSVSSSINAIIGTSSGGSYPFLGKIDDVRVYNRALSATEVSQVYLGGP